MECIRPIGAALACALAAGCGDRGETVTILAAASLTEAFGELGEELERRDPGLTVRFSFAASSTLAAQVAEGAPGDVFATADMRTMRIAQEAGVLAGEPVIFARNTLVIAVPAGNPAGVSSLADLARPEILVALCSRPVPCGTAAQAALRAAGLSVTPVTWERDVKAVLTKVMLGEVDAGLVYATDARAAGDRIEAIPFPEAREVVNAYPIAVLRDAPSPRAARTFVDLVLSEPGRAVLTDAGFEEP
ncbi:MAG: molybdate ABC transporter substrate-binding protein [Gemmatimonadota bacterium]